MRSNQGRSWSHLHQLPFDQTLISTRLLPTTLFHIFTLSKVLNFSSHSQTAHFLNPFPAKYSFYESPAAFTAYRSIARHYTVWWSCTVLLVLLCTAFAADLG